MKTKIKYILMMLPLPLLLGSAIYFVGGWNGVGYGAWTHFDGFSESIFDYIVEVESENELQDSI